MRDLVFWKTFHDSFNSFFLIEITYLLHSSLEECKFLVYFILTTSYIFIYVQVTNTYLYWEKNIFNEFHELQFGVLLTKLSQWATFRFSRLVNTYTAKEYFGCKKSFWKISPELNFQWLNIMYSSLFRISTLC